MNASKMFISDTNMFRGLVSRFQDRFFYLFLAVIIVVCSVAPVNEGLAAEVEKHPENSQVQSQFQIDSSCQELLAGQKELKRELRNLKREVVMLKGILEKPGSREIFAGIGYILGLLGVASFFKSRSKRS